VCDNYAPHLTTRVDRRVGEWAEANNVEIAYTPTSSSWLNRIEAQFTALCTHRLTVGKVVNDDRTGMTVTEKRSFVPIYVTPPMGVVRV
jgi:hypothetical protein